MEKPPSRLLPQEPGIHNRLGPAETGDPRAHASGRGGETHEDVRASIIANTVTLGKEQPVESSSEESFPQDLPLLLHANIRVMEGSLIYLSDLVAKETQLSTVQRQSVEEAEREFRSAAGYLISWIAHLTSWRSDRGEQQASLGAVPAPAELGSPAAPAEGAADENDLECVGTRCVALGICNATRRVRSKSRGPIGAKVCWLEFKQASVATQGSLSGMARWLNRKRPESEELTEGRIEIVGLRFFDAGLLRAADLQGSLGTATRRRIARRQADQTFRKKGARDG
ncbi:MAG: hypothetical protein HYV42_03505 [Candidatus Magasanikbacteria bacterium]|nr:hypothetical protein [Candidatus Magasanikbacteria bacterium]